MKTNIIPSKVKSTGAAPSTLKELGIHRILHRIIIKWVPYLGTYGMGGPGFFGLQLEQTASQPKEWLVLTLWGASEWLNLDGRWLSSHPNQYYIQKPLLPHEVTQKLIGCELIEADIEDNRSIIKLARDLQLHILEVPMDSNRLPRWGGTLEPRKWNSEESLLDAWVVTEDDYLIV